jgi:hypothetical protein
MKRRGNAMPHAGDTKGPAKYTLSRTVGDVQLPLRSPLWLECHIPAQVVTSIYPTGRILDDIMALQRMSAFLLTSGRRVRQEQGERQKAADVVTGDGEGKIGRTEARHGGEDKGPASCLA